jgi:SNF2 family DNA or RNA helicase
MGAALALILEEKLTLGLSSPPVEKTPIESLNDDELIKLAVEERHERAKKENIVITSIDNSVLWTDYVATNKNSGKSYKVALRGWKRGESFCSCPDYRINTLGTCKHILYALNKVKIQFDKSIKEKPFKVKKISVYIRYGEKLEIRVLIPDRLPLAIRNILEPVKEKAIDDVEDLLHRILSIKKSGTEVQIYPDAEEYIDYLLYRKRVEERIREIRKNPGAHPLRKSLLKEKLLPYQLDGIAFAVGAGRAIIADDMGLGKTIQGIGVAELLSMDMNISKVLIICPASLKSQWYLEIKRFANRSCQVVLGSAKDRAEQYNNTSFYTVCNYEQVLRDINSIEKVAWDLIILDEGQRIKNWEAKTTRIVKGLNSPFALVLSGTPLQNRLGELFSVTGFIDDRRLGPAFRFFNRHRVTNEKGRVLGYKNLDELREKLKPVLIRRTRKQVLEELPPRTTEILRIPPTGEQYEMHNSQYRIINSIVSKKYLTEMDLLRLQKALLLCRMAANSTFLVDKQAPGYSSKLKELDNLLDQLKEEEDRKIILFSEWTTMLNLIEPILEKHKLNYVRLDGSVPQKKRQALMHQFQKNPDCKMFITTNAGSTGLNLQEANTVINVDLPWNPAILEQRIARAHRMGQKRPVQVYLLVTENTLEENLLGTLSAKHELSLAVLDPNAEMTTVDLVGGIEELKRRLEVLLGTPKEAPLDESLKVKVEKESHERIKKEKIANAGGQLFSAAFDFIGEMLPKEKESEETSQMAETFKARLSECLEKDEDGQLKMILSFPDETAIDNLSKSLARLIRMGS